MKNLIDTYFRKHYNPQRHSVIDEISTEESQFDLCDSSPFLFPVGNGYASFDNAHQNKIHILQYEKYINSFAGTVFERG